MQVASGPCGSGAPSFIEPEEQFPGFLTVRQLPTRLESCRSLSILRLAPGSYGLALGVTGKPVLFGAGSPRFLGGPLA